MHGIPHPVASLSGEPTLRQRHLDLLATTPSLRQRDAADRLGVSEAALVASLPEATELARDFPALLRALSRLGPLKCITRNQYSVQEFTGELNHLELGREMGLALNPGGLDLRFFLKHWQRAFAVTQVARQRVLYSIQFYDRHGTAVGKFYLTDENRLGEWNALLARFAGPALPLDELAVETPTDRQLNATELEQFRQDWLALQDIHHFNRLLVNYGQTRRSAFERAPEQMAEPLECSALRQVLEQAATTATPIMIFTGNRGMVQIHSGRIPSLIEREGWLNLFSADFTLHLDPTGIDSVWRVRRPTRDGIITAIEAFDAQGTTLLTLFGVRREGEREDPDWRLLCESQTAREFHHAA